MNHTVRRATLWCFVSSCIGLALYLLARDTTPPEHLSVWLIWLVACTVGEAFWVSIGDGEATISMALALDIAALCTLGAADGIRVVALSTLLAGCYPHRRSWFKIFFNAAQSALAACVALLILHQFRPGAAADLLPLHSLWPALYAAGFAFFLVNSGLVAVAMSLASEQTPWHAWRENFGNSFELLSTLALLSVAGFLLAAYQQLGATALIALLPLMAVIRHSSAHEAAARARRRMSSHSTPTRQAA